MQGSIPHMFQWVNRIIRPKEEQTPQYLSKYLAWDELTAPVRKRIVELLTTSEPHWNNPSEQIELIPGVTATSDGENLTIDRQKYQEWRDADPNPSFREPLQTEAGLGAKEPLRGQWEAEPYKKKRWRAYRTVQEWLKKDAAVVDSDEDKAKGISFANGMANVITGRTPWWMDGYTPHYSLAAKEKWKGKQ